MLRLASAEALRIRQHAENGYPHEVVGILAGDAASGTVTRVAHLVNERSSEARTRYRVSGLMVMRAEQALEAEGLQVVHGELEVVSKKQPKSVPIEVGDWSGCMAVAMATPSATPATPATPKETSIIQTRRRTGR